MSILSSIKAMFGGAKVAKPTTPPIGEVTHYYDKAGVAVVRFNKKVSVGTSVRFHGATTDFTETIGSMQLDHEAVDSAEAGKEIGIKVKSKARDGDKVYSA